jgi:very-short-patch-repair endonuclease
MTKRVAGLIAAAEARNGLILLEDFKSLGICASARYKLIAEGVIRPVHRGTVFALGEAPLDIEAEIAAACWAVPNSWASGSTAAEYWGIRRIPRGRLELSTHSDRTPRMSGVRIRRTNFLEVEYFHPVSGGVVSTPRQTLFEVAFETDDRTLLSAYEDCLNKGLVTVESVREYGSRVVKMGRPGSARFKRVILGRPDELPVAMSHPELVLAVALEDQDQRWKRQWGVALPGGSNIRIDVARPDIRLGVEVDGHLHDSELGVRSDKHRDLAVARVGWQILRVTTTDVEEDLRSVTRQVLEIARAREDLRFH